MSSNAEILRESLDALRCAQETHKNVLRKIVQPLLNLDGFSVLVKAEIVGRQVVCTLQSRVPFSQDVEHTERRFPLRYLDMTREEILADQANIEATLIALQEHNQRKARRRYREMERDIGDYDPEDLWL